MSMTSPIWKYTLFSMPRTRIDRKAPMQATGRERMTAMGTDQLSYWAAKKRKTNRNAKARTSPV